MHSGGNHCAKHSLMGDCLKFSLPKIVLSCILKTQKLIKTKSHQMSMFKLNLNGLQPMTKITNKTSQLTK